MYNTDVQQQNTFLTKKKKKKELKRTAEK